MHTPRLFIALLAALCAAATAGAQSLPPPPGGAPHAPSSEELATVPNLSAAEQVELRKILIQRRNAHEAAHEKARAEFDALHAKERSEHERIDEQASEQARKLLGEEGYRNFAQWDLAHRGPPGAGAGPHAPMRAHGERIGGPERDLPRADDGTGPGGGEQRPRD